MENNIGEARRLYEQVEGKFTQEDAARFFEVSLGTYRNWEQGKGRLNGTILSNIALKYGTSVDYLLCRVDDPTPYPRPRNTMPVNEEEAHLINTYRKKTRRKPFLALFLRYIHW